MVVPGEEKLPKAGVTGAVPPPPPPPPLLLPLVRPASGLKLAPLPKLGKAGAAAVPDVERAKPLNPLKAVEPPSLCSREKRHALFTHVLRGALT